MPEIDVGVRILRYGRLAQHCRRAGHRVVFWTSTFDHAKKSSRFQCDRTIVVDSGYSVRFLHAQGYRRNSSLRRIAHNRSLARKFAQAAEQADRPDIVFAGIPCVELVEAAVRYSRSRSIPVVADVQDIWPDIYLTAVPSALRWVARRFLFMEFRRVQWACRNASAITAVSKNYLTWGLVNAGRVKSDFDAVFYLGAKDPFPDGDRTVTTLKDQARIKFSIPTAGLRAVYLGQFGKSYDVRTVVRAAALDQRFGRDVTYIMVGAGDADRSIRREAHGLSNIRFLGWLGPADASGVLLNSDVGLAAYAARATQSMPYKPFEYLAAGLPIVFSLGGELQDLAAKEQIGYRYEAGDPVSLSAAIARFADVDQRSRSAQRARELFSRDFNEEAVYPRLLQHLLRIAHLR